LTSLSRIADRVISKEQLEGARKLRLLLSKYDELEFLIRVGEYKSGKDALADEAIEKHEKIMNFLKQSVHNNIEYDDTVLQQKLDNVKSKLEKDVEGSH
jgi:type III secretion protein N (ATPase)